MGYILLIVPLIAVLCFFIIKKKQVLHGLSVLASAVLLTVSILLTMSVIADGTVEYTALGGLFYIDSLSVIILDITVFISFMASIYSVGYLEEELKHGKISPDRLRTYYILMYTFIFAMVFALTVKNMGLTWIAIEATTLASAFLVGFYNDKHSIEAAWKYVIICSVGIAIALVGIVFLHISSMNVIEESQALDWTAFYNSAGSLNIPALRLAFIFIFIGYGTKAGLAPMHTWLPDAHSQAPSPISAMLSGVLLNSAMYGIISIAAIVNKGLGSTVFTGRLLIATGLLSILTAAIFIMTQKDYKRLLAYSSIEHMGIISFSLGLFTPAAVFGALLHMINHSFTKSMLFLSSGSIYLKYGTKNILRVKNVLKILPVTGMVMLLGIFAIAGTPPFSVFFSEFYILSAAFGSKHFLLGAVVVILLAIVFAGMAVTAFRMFFSEKTEDEVKPGEINFLIPAVVVVLLVVISFTGLFIPEEVKQLLTAAQKIILGS
jgi:hydrogenase-4 component F